MLLNFGSTFSANKSRIVYGDAGRAASAAGTLLVSSLWKRRAGAPMNATTHATALKDRIITGHPWSESRYVGLKGISPASLAPPRGRVPFSVGFRWFRSRTRFTTG